MTGSCEACGVWMERAAQFLCSAPMQLGVWCTARPPHAARPDAVTCVSRPAQCSGTVTRGSAGTQTHTRGCDCYCYSTAMQVKSRLTFLHPRFTSRGSARQHALMASKRHTTANVNAIMNATANASGAAPKGQRGIRTSVHTPRELHTPALSRRRVRSNMVP